MTELRNALSAVAAELAVIEQVAQLGKQSFLADMAAFRSLVQASCRPELGDQSVVILSLAGAVVTADCRGIAMEIWVPELVDMNLMEEAGRLELALLNLRQVVLDREAYEQRADLALCM